MISTQVLRFPPLIEPPPIIANFAAPAAPAAPAALPASPAPEVAPSKRRRETEAAPVLVAPKRPRYESESSAASIVCESVLFTAVAAGAGDCWRRIVEAGLNDPRKLLSRFDHELEALGIPPDAFPCLRRGLGRYRGQ